MPMPTSVSWQLYMRLSPGFLTRTARLHRSAVSITDVMLEAVTPNDSAIALQFEPGFSLMKHSSFITPPVSPGGILFDSIIMSVTWFGDIPR